MNDTQPGQVVTPHSSSEEPQLPQPLPNGQPAPDRPEAVPEPTPAPSPAAGPDAMSVSVPQANGFTPSDPALNDVTWTAAEFIEHEKSANWYGALAAVGVIIAALVYFLTKDKISTAVVVVVLIGFGFYAARKPQTQEYRLSVGGIQIGSKVYNFHDFKAFSVVEDGAVISVILSPLRRFMPPLTIYVAPQVEEQVIDFLSAFMPFEQHRADAVDSLMRKIRF
jgi:hypothetical protein